MVNKAIHKPSGKVVSADKVSRDSSWIGTTNDEWIATEDTVLNSKSLLSLGITEVPLLYISTHERYNKGVPTNVRCHFRSNCEQAVMREGINESDEHKIAKEMIAEKLWDKQIKFLTDNKTYTVDDFGEFDILIEERLSDNNCSKIADVLVKFDRQHPDFKKGIVIEVQLSEQNNDATTERTWRRVEEGYTVVWLFRNDFDEKFNLKKDFLILKPYTKLYNDYREYYKELDKNDVKRYSLEIDRKIQNLEHISNEIISEIQAKMQEATNNIRNKEQEMFSRINEKSEKTVTENVEKIEAGIEYRTSRIAEEHEKKINEAISQKSDTMMSNLLNKHLHSGEIDKKINKFVTEKVTEGLENNQIESNIDEIVQENIKKRKDEVRDYIKNEVKSTVDTNLNQIIEKENFDDYFKKRFGETLADFVRIFLNARLYDFMKTIKAQQKEKEDKKERKMVEDNPGLTNEEIDQEIRRRDQEMIEKYAKDQEEQQQSANQKQGTEQYTQDFIETQLIEGDNGDDN